MEWILFFLILFIITVFSSRDKTPTKKDSPPPPEEQPTKPREQTRTDQLKHKPTPTKFEWKQREQTRTDQLKNKPTPTPAPTKFDWQQQEANNEALRKQETLKARGDGYELHIGRMFERKGDLVIYNGLLRGYADQGVDLIVIPKNQQWVHLIQCKHWKRYEFTTEHLTKIHQKLSNYQRDYKDLQPEAICHYLAIHFTDAQIKQLLKDSQHHPFRKTLYLATDHVMTAEVKTQLTPMADNIYRYQDMKIVISGMD